MSGSATTSLRFRFFAAGLWLFTTAVPALAQDITLTLSPAQVAEIIRLVDLQPLGHAPPAEFWQLQDKIGVALARSSVEVRRAVVSARSAGR